MKTEKIEIGTLVWWKRIGNSSGQNINCPGIISKVTQNGFSVVTFDSMEESGEIPFGSEAQRELRTTSIKRAFKYHKQRTGFLRNQMVVTRDVASTALQNLQDYSQKTQCWVRSYGSKMNYGDLAPLLIH